MNHNLFVIYCHNCYNDRHNSMTDTCIAICNNEMSSFTAIIMTSYNSKLRLASRAVSLDTLRHNRRAGRLEGGRECT